MDRVHQEHPPSNNQDNPRWCLLREEALRRGYRLKNNKPNTRGFTKTLISLGVEIRGTRKERFVCPSEVDAAWSRLPLVKSSTASANDDVLVASLIQGRR